MVRIYLGPCKIPDPKANGRANYQKLANCANGLNCGAKVKVYDIRPVDAKESSK